MVTPAGWTGTRRAVITLALVLVAAAPAFAGRAPDRLVGLRLDRALHLLQADGLRIVFSSELVTPGMRVEAEPRARGARERLSEVLAPHGLAVSEGPAGMLLVVRAPAAPRDGAPPSNTRIDAPPSGGAAPARAGPYRERVLVTATPDLRSGPRPARDHVLSASDLRTFGSPGIDDPLRAVQALAGVAATDDFRSDISVRGSDPRHARVLVDGVAAPWLHHAAAGRGDTGSLTMIRGDLVETAALQIGGYARRTTSQLGPEVSLTLREGSRRGHQMRAGASTTGTTASGEGPIGAEGRGSWLVGLRKSHVEWPVGKQDHQYTVFGYSDVLATLAYDLGPRHRVKASLVAGVSNVERDDPDPLAVADGTNRSALLSLAWQSILGTRTVVRQQASWIAHDFVNRDRAGRGLGRGENAAAAYRVDATTPAWGGLFETGAVFQKTSGIRQGTWLASTDLGFGTPAGGGLSQSWIEQSAHLSFRRAIGSRVRIAPGARIAHSGLVDRSAHDAWVEAEWAITPAWQLTASAARVHQFPDLEHLRGRADPTPLRPERAAQYDAGVRHQSSATIAWRVGAFARRERGLLMPAAPFGAGAAPAGTFTNGRTGHARGLELLVERRGTRWSGWTAYAYSVARYADGDYPGEFRADFDQRHTVNAALHVALPREAAAGLTFRGGSNFPLRGFVVSSHGRMFLSDRANQSSLPAYARLDVRAEKRLRAAGRGMTLFAEVLNVLGRRNMGPGPGRVLGGTGEVVGVTEPLFPRLFVAGLRVEF